MDNYKFPEANVMSSGVLFCLTAQTPKIFCFYKTEKQPTFTLEKLEPENWLRKRLLILCQSTHPIGSLLSCSLLQSWKSSLQIKMAARNGSCFLIWSHDGDKSFLQLPPPSDPLPQIPLTFAHIFYLFSCTDLIRSEASKLDCETLTRSKDERAWRSMICPHELQPDKLLLLLLLLQWIKAWCVPAADCPRRERTGLLV